MHRLAGSVVGRGVADGTLARDELTRIAREGLAALPVDGCRVLVLIPDRTRTMPMPFFFELLNGELGTRVAALDYLVALGTHPPLGDRELSALVGCTVVDGRTGGHRVLNHRWDDPAMFVELGTIPGREIESLTGGRASQDVPVALNRHVVEYDHIIICGPVFPHEVAGFSGGTKYFFPGIAAAEIIHFTHWLGALITSFEMIGTAETPVRAVIDRAASLLPRPVSLMAIVVARDGVAGLYCGEVHQAWRQATALSARRHVVWVERPYARVLAVMPEMYVDLWTAAKGMYKTEPAVADGGEVVIYAPHVNEVSYVHGRLIDEIGYHCRDYFVQQWDRFRGYPGGILAHSTHLKGLGTFDRSCGLETSRIRVTLATGIPRERCERLSVGYLDPASVDIAAWQAHARDGWIVVPRAGELLYRVGRPPELAALP